MENVESELYNLKNSFYTHQHRAVLAYALDGFSEEYRLSAQVFQIRSKVALGEDASVMIDKAKTNFPDNNDLFHLLQAWNDFFTFGTDDSTYFNDVATYKTELQAVLTLIYLVKLEKSVDLALERLTEYVESEAGVQLEALMYLIQFNLIKGNFTAAFKLFSSFLLLPALARDLIIYQVLESWVHSLKGESDNISSAYYFYDELLSAADDEDVEGKLVNLTLLLALTIQLKHYPEALELLEQIDSLAAKPNGDLIANKITLDYATENGANIPELLQQLKSADDEHPALQDLKEKSQLFDEIVAKYKVGA